MSGTNVWRRAGLEYLLLVAVLLLVWHETALAMAGIWWRSDTFAHAMLVPPISIWLIWRDRQRWLALTPSRWAWALLPLAAAAVLGLLGELAQVAAASQFALVFSLQALTLLVLGPAVTRALAFPLLFLLFAVPVGEFMLPWMMGWTADFTVAALRMVGVPVYREGLQFVIPSGHWSVVEACSGVRYLMASMMVGTLFAYLNFNSLGRRLAFVGVSIAVPLLANWLRAFGIVMLGHVSGNRLATGADHLVYGWVFFGLVMLVMFMIGARFAQAPVPPAQVQARVRPNASVIAILLALALLVLPIALAAGLRTLSPAQAQPALQLAFPGWTIDAARPDWAPAIEVPDAQWRSRFVDAAGGEVSFDLAFYPRQRAGAKAISGENVLVRADDKNWQVIGRDAQGWQIKRLGGLDDSRYMLRRWHWVNGRFIESPAMAKLAHVLQLLQGRGDAAALVVLMTPADAQASERLDRFWLTAQAPLNECLAAASQAPQGHNAGRCR